MLFSKHRPSVAVCMIGTLLCGSVSALAAETHGNRAASAASAASAVDAASGGAPALGIMNADSLPPNFTGDDPEHVRDALAGHPSPGQAPSITSRVRTFLSHPFRKREHGASEVSEASESQAQPNANPNATENATPNATPNAGTNAQTDRTFVFVIPVSYGVRYLSKKKMLTVNVSLASPGSPGAILLKQTIKGQSGRKLVVAPEAKEKGFIQTFDVIQLKPEDSERTTVTGRALLPNFGLDHGNGDFAIVLICTLEPPYLIDDIEHSAPTDEEPTDITRRTSTLNGIVDAAWLIDRKDGTIVTKRLRLVK